mgnify:CR=1 FL=1
MKPAPIPWMGCGVCVPPEITAEAPEGRLKDALMALGRGVLKRHGQG